MERMEFVGVVSAWFPDRGFGFLNPENGDEKVFCHYSDIVSNVKFKTLLVGQRVSFDLETDGQKHRKALNVTVIS